MTARDLTEREKNDAIKRENDEKGEFPIPHMLLRVQGSRVA